ncbi:MULTISPECIES: YqjD family protein [unclassified Herbaspirillum]|uniref:DUF883 family protein n=1 Tax=unclassified Herbaspirillum TaxID=2624150 RepID=UPI0011547D50|nr:MULTISPECIES: DUF883 family protein [unclassified Herbaspirillum]MBB5391667.1 ElaB/YqjD/DUF883 family membrane-anchored ribosome-binding protein [Herbaspirillum sp. SJZ102]TQK03086.1 ElaB/YqjD/DUF883 family membrane-anchored ribosome-binding protein [Herbaspirillum sp. SJZ130]TQK06526.1 ElaB/YqjD/DUF883 family membrane-anchored ribosome-binding protein [Herbaspirillum sp. SJZ106]TWC62414.1 ElaB/YqjD/DUF883 family membrane-anchored ribosome-binding protein [Herbaspirillum sp. SJZ099]
MQANNLKTVRNDVRALLQQAQDLFAEAAAATGKNADELRAKGQQVLDQALNTAQDAQSAVMHAGRQIVTTTDDYVQSNPWRAIVISSGIGLLVGLAVGRCAERD